MRACEKDSIQARGVFVRLRPQEVRNTVFWISVESMVFIFQALREYMGGIDGIRSQPSFKNWLKIAHYYLENKALRNEDAAVPGQKLEERC